MGSTNIQKGKNMKEPTSRVGSKVCQLIKYKEMVVRATVAILYLPNRLTTISSTCDPAMG